MLPNRSPAEKERERRWHERLGPTPESSTHGPTVVWIDRETFLLRRIEEQTKFETFGTQSTTTYEPLIDAL